MCAWKRRRTDRHVRWRRAKEKQRVERGTICVSIGEWIQEETKEPNLTWLSLSKCPGGFHVSPCPSLAVFLPISISLSRCLCHSVGYRLSFSLSISRCLSVHLNIPVSMSLSLCRLAALVLSTRPFTGSMSLSFCWLAALVLSTHPFTDYRALLFFPCNPLPR